MIPAWISPGRRVHLKVVGGAWEKKTKTLAVGFAGRLRSGIHARLRV